ncbi:hypothetical protein ABT337_15250 [Saccharopolyspora hirsuta]|uniref:ESX-1 secretion-associated protein n=1 Tax=Saccharopolyspora hirsuta TaxID=1837 RepID=A0A5M7C718_SACHI|nr:hypothetical protein [Saccharopolyspora hirsuta]KAA5837250.1 hypothetical protein F1721_05495 [Saccharopolyspora hirsuta]
MSYQVLVEELRKASDATVSAVEQAGESKLGSVGDKISQALPGTTAAPAASSAGRSWTDSVKRWCRSGTTHAEALRRSADTYEGTDQGAVSDLKTAGGA